MRPDSERGSRYQLGAAIVNLTGSGSASRRMAWDRAGLVTELRTVERNLESEAADGLLREIEAGRWSRAILPWVPLMAGADAVELIDWWKRLAEAEPDPRRRSDYAVLAKVVCGTGRAERCVGKSLEGWSVEESTVVNGWIAQGEARGEARGEAKATRAAIVRIGSKRFGAPSAEQRAALDAITDIEHLMRLQERLLDAANWDDLLATPDRLPRRRSDYAVLAKVFAERAGRKDVWEKSLEGWSVEESTVVNGWIAQGEARGEARGEAKATRAAIVRIGSKRFGAPSAEQRAALDAITDIEHLMRLQERLLDAANWDDLLATP